MMMVSCAFQPSTLAIKVISGTSQQGSIILR